MLQIISGKFFTDKERYIHQGKGILYSNCSWVGSIETCIGVLEPVDHHGDISGYVFNYKNQIEKDDILVRCGDDEIVEQFKIICSFGLESYFSEYREQVVKICSPLKSKNTQGYPAHQFLPGKVSLNKNLNKQNIEHFVKIINKIISLDRKSYKSIVSALRTLSNSVETVAFNIDLAYSMIVYCLESLSQRAKQPEISWNDWDQNSKDKYDRIFSQIHEDSSVEIKKLLLEDKQFKLQQRYISFVKDNLSETFFINEAKDIKLPLRMGQLERALINSYQMRSKFVHSLQPIQDQIRHPSTGKYDVFTFSESPYLTYSGLFRLASHVIRNYIFSLSSCEKEAFNYRQDLPGIMTMEMAPKYWIWKDESFNGKTANKRLSAFLGQLESGEPVTELTKVMGKIKATLNQTPFQQRAPMLYLFWIYNFVLREDLRTENWQGFVEKYQKHFLELRFENITVRAISGIEIPWTVYDCINQYKSYSKNRHKNGHLSLTPLTESIVLCSIANKAQNSGYGSEYNWLMNSALLELSGRKDLQSFLYNKMICFKEIPIDVLVNWNKRRGNDEVA